MTPKQAHKVIDHICLSDRDVSEETLAETLGVPVAEIRKAQQEIKVRDAERSRRYKRITLVGLVLTLLLGKVWLPPMLNSGVTMIPQLGILLVIAVIVSIVSIMSLED